MRLLIVGLSFLYLASQAFDSVLRWGFDLFGLGAAIYARDISLVVVVMGCIYLMLREQRDITRMLFVIAFLAWGVAFAIWSQLGILQILFGVKVWLPLVAGMMLVESGVIQALNRPSWWFWLWGLTCLGIFINYFVRMPWAGLVVQVGDLAVSANRDWTAGAINRLSGFSRTSYDAAIVVLLIYLYLSIVCEGKFVKLVLAVVSCAAIALTTTKGAAGAFLICAPVGYVLGRLKRPGSAAKWACMAALFVVAAIGCVVPLISMQLSFPRWEDNSIEAWLFSSFVMRAWDTWPTAFSLLKDQQWLTGRGIGGVGAAQYVFESGAENPADSFFVYVFVTAGIVGALLYAYLAVASVRLKLEDRTHQAAYLLLLVTFSYGLTVNLVESAPFAMALGCACAVLG
jgi:hypothetical protein